MFRSRSSPRAVVALPMSGKAPPAFTKLDKIENFRIAKLLTQGQRFSFVKAKHRLFVGLP